MSKVGDVDKMYGKNFSIVTTDASGVDILEASESETSFISSSLIIASPIDEFGNDCGAPALLVTDADGAPMRLTYTIKPGNGLVLAYTASSDYSDVLSLAIDNDTLQAYNGDVHNSYLFVSGKGLTENSQYLTVSGINNIEVDIDEFPDDNRIKIVEQPTTNSSGNTVRIKRMSVDASKLVDGVTLITNQNTYQGIGDCFEKQKISVNLPNIIDNKTITTILVDSKRVMAIDAGFLTPASTTKAGVVMIDGSTIKSNNGRIYVDSSNLRQITNKGGIGVIKLQAAGKSDLYVDNSGFVRTDPKYMPKCGVVDKSKTSSGWGVCAVDGTSITATHDGVLKVRSAGLDVATNKELGVVRPDNTTITIAKSGVISVNANNLPSGSASAAGLVKYDNSTIVKNAQGQLSVKRATDWDTAISDLNTRISSLQEQLAAIRTDLNNTLTTVVAKAVVPFNVMTNTGKMLESMMIHVPNVSSYKYGSHSWDTANCSGTFKIEYAAGYIFTCRLNGGSGSSWMQSCSIVINGQRYGMNQDIKLSSNSATCSVELTISGYGNSKTTRPQGSWSLEFRDNNGNPLKSVNMYVHSCRTLTRSSDFSCSLNGKSYEAISSPTLVSSTRISNMITKAPISIGNTTLANRNLAVNGAILMCTR